MRLFMQNRGEKLWCAMAVLFIATGLWAQSLPYQNPNLSSEERAKDLIARLTLEEKAALMCDVSD